MFASEHGTRRVATAEEALDAPVLGTDGMKSQRLVATRSSFVWASGDDRINRNPWPGDRLLGYHTPLPTHGVIRYEYRFQMEGYTNSLRGWRALEQAREDGA